MLSLTENTQWIATVLHELTLRVMNCSKLHELPYGHDIRCNSIHGGGETPTRNHGEANSWCASINSSIKTNRARVKGEILLFLLLFFFLSMRDLSVKDITLTTAIFFWFTDIVWLLLGLYFQKLYWFDWDSKFWDLLSGLNLIIVFHLFRSFFKVP